MTEEGSVEVLCGTGGEPELKSLREMKASVHVTVWEAESASRARGEGRLDPEKRRRGGGGGGGERLDSKKARMHEPGMG